MKTGNDTIGQMSFLVIYWGGPGVSRMTLLLKEIQKTEILSVWRKSCITPLHKQKGDPPSCFNYQSIKLLGLKIEERIIEAKLRESVDI